MSSEDQPTKTQRWSPPAGGTAIVLTGFYAGLEMSIDRERIVIATWRTRKDGASYWIWARFRPPFVDQG